MTSPIEAMAKAYHESYPEQYRDRWDDVCEAERSDYCSGMRAALLALADCEIPPEAYEAAGNAAHDGNATEFLDVVFKTMLRSIATGG